MQHMSKEHRDSTTTNVEDLNNEQTVHRILESGSDEELERLREHAATQMHKPVSNEEMQRYRKFAQQRRRIIEESDRAAEKRKATNPAADELERAIGLYRERLEFQVRDAVFALRQKGYSSYESGFSGLERQQITFHDSAPELVTHTFSEKLLQVFTQYEAEPYCKENAVGFTLKQSISDETLKALWDLLVEEIPPLKTEQAPTTVRTAQRFREEQNT